LLFFAVCLILCPVRATVGWALGRFLKTRCSVSSCIIGVYDDSADKIADKTQSCALLEEHFPQNSCQREVSG
jgi:hypothetical protein